MLLIGFRATQAHAVGPSRDWALSLRDYRLGVAERKAEGFKGSILENESTRQKDGVPFYTGLPGATISCHLNERR